MILFPGVIISLRLFTRVFQPLKQQDASRNQIGVVLLGLDSCGVKIKDSMEIWVSQLMKTQMRSFLPVCIGSRANYMLAYQKHSKS